MTFYLIKYTPKSLLLDGPTKERREDIKMLGGKWIFPKGLNDTSGRWMFHSDKEHLLRKQFDITAPLQDRPVLSGDEQKAKLDEKIEKLVSMLKEARVQRAQLDRHESKTMDDLSE